MVSDSYFRTIPSLRKTAVAFHAKDDVPEIRYLFFKMIATLPVTTQFIVARKIERVFRSSFHAEENLFYDHLVTRLFENVLRRHQSNLIYFAKRGSRDRQVPLSQAIESSVNQFEDKWKTAITSTYQVQAQSPRGEPCLSVIDYMNWAVYRAFTGGDMRFFRAVEERVSLLVDLYDIDKYPGNWYNRRNPFDIQKITPL